MIITPRRLYVLSAGFLSLTALTHAQRFYGDPPNDTHPWAVHDMNRPIPPKVTPGTFSSQEKIGQAPSDARFLFDGTEASLAKWEAVKKPGEENKKMGWIVKDGALTVVPGQGDIKTLEEFGDCQLHVEWKSDVNSKGTAQWKSNSGVFFMGQTEVQVLDTYEVTTYPDGIAGSVYGINPPLANALHPTGAWQTYDIIFRRPLHKDGKEIDPGYFTVFMNGVVVQDHLPLEGGGGHRGRSTSKPYPEKGPFQLQDHGDIVSFRNIWYRPLPPRNAEGGTIGAMSPEATTALRKKTADTLRKLAATQSGRDQLLTFMESLSYEKDAATEQKIQAQAKDYVQSVLKLSAADLEAQKGSIKEMNDAFGFLAKFQLSNVTAAPAQELGALIQKLGWNDKK
jgi:hypothetical protein